MKSVITLSVFFAMLINASAQSLEHHTIAVAGSDSETSEFQYQYTLGQAIQGVKSISNGYLTEGFHQPALVVTNVKDYSSEIDFKIYPNPTAHHVVVETSGNEYLSYRLQATNALVIQTGKLSDNNTIIEMETIPAGIYLLTIIQNTHILSTAKIIKN